MLNEYIFNFCGFKLKLCSTENAVWRLQSEKNGKFENGAAQMLASDLGERIPDTALEIEVKKTGDTYRVFEKKGSFVEITGNAVSFFDCSGTLKQKITALKPLKDGGVNIKFALGENEHIFGTGEHFDSVDRRGEKFHLYAIDKWCRTHGNTYIPVPFYISSDISGVYFNRFEHSVIDVGKKNHGILSFLQKYAPLDLYVFLKPSAKEILTAFSRLTGFAPLPPEWSFGTLVCRYHPEFSTPEGILNMANAMDENRFPFEAVICEGWWIYDRSRWDELKKVSDELHTRGKKLMVYKQCGRFPDNGVEVYGLTDDYAVKTADGSAVLRQTRSMNLLDNFHHKKMRCPDITNLETNEKWFGLWRQMIDHIGIDGAKIDFCEQFPDKPFVKFFDSRDPMGTHHWYPTLYNTLCYKLFNTRPDGGVTYTRGGGIGSQRFPFVWTGDQRREFFFLKVVLRGALSLGLSGVPFASWDMAGYQPAWLPYDRLHENEVFIRAVEMTAFSLNIQTHGNVKRPYDFDEHTRDIYRKYATIHENLRPYLYEQAKIACETGLPVLRHLFLYDAADETALKTEDEYMLGDALLVAPVLTRKNHRDIYLPKGEWVNIFNGKEYTGRQTLKNYPVALDEIAVFKLKSADFTVSLNG